MAFKREVLADGIELYLGDCLEVLPTLGRFDAVVTDTPYGIADAPIQGQGRTGKRKGNVNTWHSESAWDKSINPAWAGACCASSEIICWFGQWRKREEVASAMLYPLRAEIVWAKDCHVGPPSPLAARDERIWVFGKSGIKGATFETSVWDEPIIPTWALKHHKNEKPVPLMARLISWIGPASVCDPFMGSGTTGVACVKRGVKFTGIEQDLSHFDIACRRIEAALKQPDLFVEPPKPAHQLSILDVEPAA